MPTYRFTRVVTTGGGTIDAASPDAAKVILAADKTRISARKQFSYTLIEEVIGQSVGYQETTSADLIGEQAAPLVIGAAEPVVETPTLLQRVRRMVGL